MILKVWEKILNLKFKCKLYYPFFHFLPKNLFIPLKKRFPKWGGIIFQENINTLHPCLDQSAESSTKTQKIFFTLKTHLSNHVMVKHLLLEKKRKHQKKLLDKEIFITRSESRYGYGSESAKICGSTDPDPRGKISTKNCKKKFVLLKPESKLLKKGRL